MITYKNDQDLIVVLSDEVHVGFIVKRRGGGFRYETRGSTHSGKTFDTIEDVKKSLEGKFVEIEDWIIVELREKIGRVVRNIELGRYEVAISICSQIDEKLKAL